MGTTLSFVFLLPPVLGAAFVSPLATTDCIRERTRGSYLLHTPSEALAAAWLASTWTAANPPATVRCLRLSARCPRPTTAETARRRSWAACPARRREQA
eukprot:3726037-Rhodomonas_salina.2